MNREELGELIDKYLSGRASPEEEKFIDDFLDAHEAKQTLHHYRVSEEMWTAIEKRIQRQAGFVPSMTESGSRQRRKSFGMLAAAAFIVLLSAFIYLQRGTSDPGQNWVTSTCPKGQKSLIILPDGSRIFLNSASMVSYPENFGSGKREIALSGEAYFEIVHDEQRPLTVRSRNLITTVLGTSFNIEAFEGQPERVTVATGKVRVELAGIRSRMEAEKVIIVRNQQASYDPTHGLVTRKVAADEFVSWKNQVLYFDDNTLEEVAVRLERWYNVSIAFENENIKYCRINGQYKEVNLRSVLKSIEYMYDIEYKFSDQNHIVLYGKGCKR